MKRLNIVMVPCISIVAIATLFLTGLIGVSAVVLPQYAYSTKSCGAWSQVTSPNVGTSYNTLNGVAAISVYNIWAVGEDTNSPAPSAEFKPLVEHWNGSNWSVVKSPLQGTSDFLNGIAAVSTSNIWTVGDYRSGIDPMGPYFTLIQHWNGSTWKVIKSPSPGSIASDLAAAARVPATRSVWAVGYIQGTISQTLTAFYC